MKKIILPLSLILLLAMLAGCASREEGNSPQIAPMTLSSSQQEILDILFHPGQEFLLFEYTGGVFTKIEVWVEVYSYGELIELYGGISISDDAPMEARPIAISIRACLHQVQNKLK